MVYVTQLNKSSWVIPGSNGRHFFTHICFCRPHKRLQVSNFLTHGSLPLYFPNTPTFKKSRYSVTIRHTITCGNGRHRIKFKKLKIKTQLHILSKQKGKVDCYSDMS